MWMNQAEIEWVSERTHTCPNVRKGVRLLRRLVEAVNEQSDGWAYWSAPSKAADKLMDLVRNATELHCNATGTISDADLRKAITPIRTMVTMQRKKQKQYGNTFEFDVDAALRSLEDVPNS